MASGLMDMPMEAREIGSPQLLTEGDIDMGPGFKAGMDELGYRLFQGIDASFTPLRGLRGLLNYYFPGLKTASERAKLVAMGGGAANAASAAGLGTPAYPNSLGMLEPTFGGLMRGVEF